MCVCVFVCVCFEKINFLCFGSKNSFVILKRLPPAVRDTNLPHVVYFTNLGFFLMSQQQQKEKRINNLVSSVLSSIWQSSQLSSVRSVSYQPRKSHMSSRSLHFFTFTFYNYIVPMGFLPWENRVALPLGKASCNRVVLPNLQGIMDAGCFSVSIIHRTLTDYRIFNMGTDVNACDCTWECTDTVREFTLKVDSGR